LLKSKSQSPRQLQNLLVRSTVFRNKRRNGISAYQKKNLNKELYGDDLVLANIRGNNSQYTEHTINDKVNIEIARNTKH
jgi:hypothetical protein